ncbi:hypothetical protein [Aquimarina pacifica]|uniref:hypothetical protein n=1 Tax=Aquimarina pacifica TaxID=1296415 RepID=UPI000471245B|nr:hypothetical protein [Aquimarina pacifica]
MKYHQFSKKGQEDRSHLVANVSGGILWEDSYTSVVTPLLIMKTKIIGRDIEMTLPFIFNTPNELVIKSNDTFCESSIS